MASYILKRELKQLTIFKRLFHTNLINYTKQKTTIVKPTSPTQPKPSVKEVNPNVPGLSRAVLTANEPVGPGAAKTGEYKVPEYFNFNNFSYFEAEIEMSKYRLTQPSALRK